jgi:maleate isomerase
MLALDETLAGYGARRIALVTPYLDEIQERIVDNDRSLGLACVAERHLGDPGNFSFALVSVDTIAAMIREVAQAESQAIATVCTNLRAAPLAPALERSQGVPIPDRIAIVVWKALRLAGVDAARVQGRGRLFRELSR